MDSSLAQVMQRADLTISIANTFLVWGALLIAVTTIFITIYYNRKKQRAIKEAINEVLQKLGNDEQLRTELINKMFEDDEFKKDFRKFIDISVNDKIDRDKELEKTAQDNAVSNIFKGA